jgi:AraC-like DNA-binding protein
MRETIFNLHDLVLMMTSIQCACFALLLLVTNPPKNKSNYFLAAFLVTHAFIPMNELVLWGTDFRNISIEHFPYLFLWMGFAYYLDAVILYFYIKSLVYRDFKPRARDGIHLLPLAGFVIFLCATFYSHSLAERIELVRHDAFAYSVPNLIVDFMCKSLRVAYCSASFFLILKYKDLLKDTHSNIERVDIFWLTLLVVGFSVVTLIEATLGLVKIIHLYVDFNPDVFEIFGLTGYYVIFVLILMLFFTSIRYFSTFPSVKQAVKQKDKSKKAAGETLLNTGFAEKIDAAMRTQKLYLSPDLTLELLAETLAIPAKDLSLVLHRHFESNFYEFINSYRIEEAKKILADAGSKSKKIATIYLEVGFNSKSVFNTFFKKNVGKTPSEYRHEHLVSE